MRKMLFVMTVALFVMTVGLFVPTAVAQTQGQKTLDIYYIDTEHGKAVLYVSPSGQSVLVDAGNAGNEDRDPNRILAVFKEAGVRALDYLIISHYHGDHVGGAAGVISKIQIRQFLDHGPYSVQLLTNARPSFESYLALRRMANAAQPKAGTKIPIKGIDMTVMTSARELITAPLPGVPGAGAPNPLCREFVPTVDVRGVENDESVTVATQYGSFRVVDAGDLIGNQEHDLVCPNNRLGTADVLATTGHGQEFGNKPVFVHAVRPRITVMNNGPNDKQGPTFKTFRSSPGFQDFWQSHASEAQKDENSPEQFIANLETTPTHVGNYIKISALPDGSFTVTNSRNGFKKEYPATKGTATKAPSSASK